MSHPLWLLRRSIPTPLGAVTRPVLFLGSELKLHGPSHAHVLANAREMGFGGSLIAVPLCSSCGKEMPSLDWLSRALECGVCFSHTMAGVA